MKQVKTWRVAVTDVSRGQSAERGSSYEQSAQWRVDAPEELIWWLLFFRSHLWQPTEDSTQCGVFVLFFLRWKAQVMGFCWVFLSNLPGLNDKTHTSHYALCLLNKQHRWEVILMWDARWEVDGSVAPLSLGLGQSWQAPAPWTVCPAPIVSGGQSEDDKKQMEMLAPGLSLCTPAAYEWLSH